MKKKKKKIKTHQTHMKPKLNQTQQTHMKPKPKPNQTDQSIYHHGSLFPFHNHQLPLISTSPSKSPISTPLSLSNPSFSVSHPPPEGSRVELTENKLILAQFYSTLLYSPSIPLNSSGPQISFRAASQTTRQSIQLLSTMLA